MKNIIIVLLLIIPRRAQVRQSSEDTYHRGIVSIYKGTKRLNTDFTSSYYNINLGFELWGHHLV